MKIEKNNVVAITYELEVEGKIADKATEERPLEYIHGNHMLLQKFEDELEGKTEGDDFAFTLTPEEGYGTYDPQRKIDLPKDVFMVDGEFREDIIVVGNVIPMMDAYGQIVQGTVAEIKESAVTMDFNHPMAGKTLNFSGKVISIREATEKEIKEGLHGEYLPKEDCEGCGGHCHGDGGCQHEEGEECHCHCHDKE